MSVLPSAFTTRVVPLAILLKDVIWAEAGSKLYHDSFADCWDWAVCYGHFDVIENLLPFTTADQIGYLLEESATQGRLEHFQLALKVCGEDDRGARQKESALSAACYCGHYQIVELLLNAGVDINSPHIPLYDTPPFCAADQGNFDILTLLLARGAQIRPADLRAAMSNDHVSCVELLLKHDMTVANMDPCGLSLAAERGNLELVQLFWESGATINPEIALRKAVERADIEMLKLLVDSGMGVNDDFLIHVALSFRKPNLTVVDCLLSAGADPFSCDYPYFLRASSNGHADLVALLLKHGAADRADLGAALYSAVSNNHLETAELLLATGATVDKKTLQMARKRGHKALLKLLEEGIGFTGSVSVAWGCKG
ncbi:hypothetical protein HDV00_006326 [Rhizophlyctis rosea]|nr:hypothetical protein HDV00_006326 [Rhizophlyctis rosea]